VTWRPGVTPGWGTITLGRLALRETYDVTDDTSRTLQIHGQTSVAALSFDQVERIYDDLYGLADQVIPITWSDKAFLNGYYQVTTVKTTYSSYPSQLTASAFDKPVVLDWELTATRIGPVNAIDLESRLTGPQTRQNDFSALGEIVHAPPVGHYGYTTGGTVPPSVTRQTADGPITVYRQIPPNVNPRWGCAPQNYGGGRVRFLDSFGEERTGTDRILPATGWELNNGLVRVRPGAPGTLEIGSWTVAGWKTRQWDVTRDSVSINPWSDVSLLSNTFDTLILRCTTAPTGEGRTTTDIQLRRGARMVELFIQSDASSTLAIKLHSAEPGVAGTGTLSSTGEDIDGGRYVLTSAKTAVYDLAGGGLSVANTVLLAATIGAIPAAAPLNSNYSFESGTTGWTGVGGTLTQSTEQAKYGTNSGKLVTDGTSLDASVVSTNIAITPVTKYTFAAWVFCAHGRSATATISWRNPSNVEIGTVTKALNLLPSTWTPVLLDVASPASATQAVLTINIHQTTPWSAINGRAWNTLLTWQRPIAFVETIYVDSAPLRPALGGDSVADMFTQALGAVAEVVQGVKR
jgi:hypothetical protein